jgi:hypothetical protein
MNYMLSYCESDGGDEHTCGICGTLRTVCTCDEHTCGNCGTAGVGKRCGQCRYVRYCNISCQRAHWGFHRTECDTWRDARHLRRILLRRPTERPTGPVHGDYTCIQCGEGRANKRCGRCNTAHYCDVACQRSHWDAHRPGCGILAEVNPRTEQERRWDVNVLARLSDDINDAGRSAFAVGSLLLFVIGSGEPLVVSVYPQMTDPGPLSTAHDILLLDAARLNSLRARAIDRPSDQSMRSRARGRVHHVVVVLTTSVCAPSEGITRSEDTLFRYRIAL